MFATTRSIINSNCNSPKYTVEHCSMLPMQSLECNLFCLDTDTFSPGIAESLPNYK